MSRTGQDVPGQVQHPVQMELFRHPLHLKSITSSIFSLLCQKSSTETGESNGSSDKNYNEANDYINSSLAEPDPHGKSVIQ